MPFPASSSRSSSGAGLPADRYPSLGALRAALALTALGLAVASAFSARVWLAEQERAREFLAGSTLELPERLFAEVDREADPLRVRLRAARGVFAAELSRRPPDVAPGSPAARSDAAASARRMAAASERAASSFAARPAAWEGPLVIGGATFVGRLRTEDDRLIRKFRDWEAPMEVARQLAPGRFEPEVLLAHAYTRLWPVLSPEKRRVALGLIRRSLADLYARQDLLPAWLAAAGDRRLAFTAIPEDPDAWALAREVYAQRRDWQAMRDARVRFRHALSGRLSVTLEEARREVRRGNVDGGRERYLAVVAQAGDSDSGETLLARALDESPAGRVGVATAKSLAESLDWILDRCRYGRCPIGSASLSRLARLSGEGDPAKAASVARAAGDDELARSLERQAGGDFAVPLPPLDEPPNSDSLRLRSAETWSAGAWVERRGRLRLELVASRTAAGISVEVPSFDTGSAVVEIRLDGSFVGTFVATSHETLKVPVRISPGLHLFELASINGGPVPPAAVRLLAPPAGEGRAE